MSRLLLAALLALYTAQALAQQTGQYRIHHRLFHPALDAPVWQLRGLATVHPGATAFTPVEDAAAQFALLADALVHGVDKGGVSAGEVLYQVALEREEDRGSGHWDFSSVKACYLSQVQSDHIVLHLSPQDGKPYSLDYFVSPVPSNGACPPAPKSLAITPIDNTTVTWKLPTVPSSPELRPPPQLTTEGKVQQPEPEKSFIQKYWVYILAVCIALVVAPGGDEPKDGGRSAGGQR